MAKRSVRQIRIEGQVAYIPLTKGLEAIIDASDATEVGRFNWCACSWRSGYLAVRRQKNGKKLLLMHREILRAPSTSEVDHANLNTLDNRRSNLRLASSSQNKFNQPRRVDNKSGFKGVSYCRHTGKWRATARSEGKQVSLGRHETIEAASAAYRELCIRERGEFARF